MKLGFFKCGHSVCRWTPTFIAAASLHHQNLPHMDGVARCAAFEAVSDAGLWKTPESTSAIEACFDAFACRNEVLYGPCPWTAWVVCTAW